MSGRPRFRNKSDRVINPGASAMEIRHDFAVAPLDRAARIADERWGVDRLPTLVSSAMAEKYGRAIAHLHECMATDDPSLTAAAAENCTKGIAAMDAAAVAAGHIPNNPEIWWVDNNGRQFGFVRDPATIAQARTRHPGAAIFSVREAAVALDPAAFGVATEVLRHWPAAEVTAIRKPSPIEAQLEDEIPW
jgi:hypothetical protein